MFPLKNRVALVTGANRGLGRAFCDGLLRANVAKIYATTRQESLFDTTDSKIIPLKLDVTSAADVRIIADACRDVDLLINNAGVLHNSWVLAKTSEDAARSEMEVNYFGVLAMVRAFAPIMARNGGGAMVNILSVASWFSNPSMGTYCASKAAEMALTNAIRIELKSKRIRVVGVYAGYIDTEMAAHISAPKTDPMQVVERTLYGLEQGADHVLADDRAVEIDELVRTNPAKLYENVQRRWDETNKV